MGADVAGPLSGRADDLAAAGSEDLEAARLERVPVLARLPVEATVGARGERVVELVLVAAVDVAVEGELDGDAAAADGLVVLAAIGPDGDAGCFAGAVDVVDHYVEVAVVVDCGGAGGDEGGGGGEEGGEDGGGVHGGCGRLLIVGVGVGVGEVGWVVKRMLEVMVRMIE